MSEDRSISVTSRPEFPFSPYYEDEDVVLYHGDCRVILPCLGIADLLLTDPPYGVAYKSNRGQHDEMAGDDGSLTLADWLPLALKQLRPWRHAYIFGTTQADVSPELPLGGMTDLVWDKEILGMGDLSSPWGPAHEALLFGVYVPSKAGRTRGDGVGAARLRKGSILRCQRSNSGQNKRHPTEKPVDILRVLIESSSTFGDTVLDCFAGSGSTLVAAVLEGRKAIGIELDEQYCEVIADRLGADIPERTLF